jgi:hypothetical protein
MIPPPPPIRSGRLPSLITDNLVYPEPTMAESLYRDLDEKMRALGRMIAPGAEPELEWIDDMTCRLTVDTVKDPDAPVWGIGPYVPEVE